MKKKHEEVYTRFVASGCFAVYFTHIHTVNSLVSFAGSFCVSSVFFFLSWSWWTLSAGFCWLFVVGGSGGGMWFFFP